MLCRTSQQEPRITQVGPMQSFLYVQRKQNPLLHSCTTDVLLLPHHLLSTFSLPGRESTRFVRTSATASTAALIHASGTTAVSGWPVSTPGRALRPVSWASTPPTLSRSGTRLPSVSARRTFSSWGRLASSAAGFAAHMGWNVTTALSHNGLSRGDTLVGWGCSWWRRCLCGLSFSTVGRRL